MSPNVSDAEIAPKLAHPEQFQWFPNRSHPNKKKHPMLLTHSEL
jgi:hypothetical protein